MDGQWTFYHRNGVKEKEGVLKEGMQMVFGFFMMMKQIKSKKALLPMALKRSVDSMV